MSRQQGVLHMEMAQNTSLGAVSFSHTSTTTRKYEPYILYGTCLQQKCPLCLNKAMEVPLATSIIYIMETCSFFDGWDIMSHYAINELKAEGL